MGTTDANDKPKQFPLPSLQQFLIPGTVLAVKIFDADTIPLLEQYINDWINSTQHIVVVPGPVSVGPGVAGTGIRYSIAITYVPANF